ncbi:MAG TPA: dihydrofolate reductase family protein, partial [Bacteroidia bacterium]|nr:dihydrofolate reductase family protein [Bacteroidia bacterium]
FGPVRGNWPDESWKGWWGETPPYHGPVYVLTNHARKSIPMKGGTTFHFVTEGIDIALQRARESAGSKDIQICGGVNTIRQYLKAQLIDELHIAISPIILGSGERLYEAIDLIQLGYKAIEHKCTDKAMHLLIVKTN